jgi:hypothetical protein
VGDNPLTRTDPTGLILKVPTETDRTHFTTLLNQLCPQGGFAVDSSGNVSSNWPNFCKAGSDPEYFKAAQPTSCTCLCRAINSSEVFQLFSWGKAGGETRGNDIYIGSSTDLPGSGDTSPPSPGRVRCPEWIILGHELCGHAIYPNTTGTQAVGEENLIRAEHTCKTNCWGQRDGTDHDK